MRKNKLGVPNSAHSKIISYCGCDEKLDLFLFFVAGKFHTGTSGGLLFRLILCVCFFLPLFITVGNLWG